MLDNLHSILTISAQSVKETQETKIKVYRSWWLNGTVYAFRTFLFLECFGIPFMIAPVTTPLLPPIYFLKIAAVIMVIAGLVIALLARIALGKNLSRNVDIKKKHELITTGVYKLVRHPIYSALILMALGNFVFTWTITAPVLLFLICLLFLYKLKNEEKLLCEHFPEEYPIYKKRVKALIPFIY